MRFFDLLIMSINNLRRRKLRTGLTVLGVVIGTASIVVMVSLGIGLKENTVESYASFGSLTRIQISSGYGNQSEDDYLVDATVTKLAKIPHVKSVSPILETDVNLKQGVYQGYSNIVGMPREELEQIPLAEGKLPDVVMACVGGGSNSIGMFADFITARPEREAGTVRIFPKWILYTSRFLPCSRIWETGMKTARKSIFSRPVLWWMAARTDFLSMDTRSTQISTC